ncbi:MAG: MFS transporter [Firmicutes bacterium]|nr:MFS transporter [Bacillota bacterium]
MDTARRTDPRRITLYSVAHFVNDYATGSIPALLPLFAAAHHWSYSALGSLVLVANGCSAALQPVLGGVADRLGGRWLAPLGLLATGLGLVLAGLAPTYIAVLAAVAVAGVGASAFHPEASQGVRRHAGDRPATALSWFQVAGNAGMAAGPLAVALFVHSDALERISWIGMPAFLVGAPMVALAWRERRGDTLAAARHRAGAAVAQRVGLPERAGRGAGRGTPAGSRARVADTPRVRLVLAILCLVIALRSFIQVSLGTYGALYYQKVYGWSATAADYLMFAFLLVGAAGTLAGGYIADAVGERRVTYVCLTLLFLPALAFRLLPPVPGALFLILGGALSMGSWSVTTSYGQRLLPHRLGMVSGITTGLTIGTAGLAAVVLGWLADMAGLAWVLDVAIACTVPAALLARALPELHEPQARRAETAAV